ncbi:MAG: hypothetical protein J6R42_01080 [Clostridia bacterium]|nr:hypothetical protein [Clostridia bacterium]
MYVNFQDICDEIALLQRDLKRIVVAIDGIAGGGKSTLAQKIAEVLPGCEVIHMDDFYLHMSQRTPERMAQIGGHMNYERFTHQVAMPLWKGLVPVYQVFDCKTQRITRTVECKKDANIYLIEGTYSTHPEIPDIYDLRIFVETDHDLRLARILERVGNGAVYDRYLGEWIPREQAYFEAFMTKELCDLVYCGGAEEHFEWQVAETQNIEEILPFIENTENGEEES